ncbi:lipoprotein YcdR [Escherichia coli]|uniref:Lipoprotein YcdR n=1 Tax=Escherichia coli TaxID=562 RepID=A0A484WQI6_ECOLX|nr:lipoprotein YcdR [Escherichia coli]
MLTFDDGYQSFYTRVFPILQAFQWPAVWAPVGSWVDTPADETSKIGDEMVDREYFATWQQVRELRVPGSLRSLLIHEFSLRYSG